VKLPKQFFRNLAVSAWYVVATIVVLVAILFGCARLLVPYISDYKADISEIASEYIGQTVIVDSLKAEWYGLGPALVFEKITLQDEKGEKPVLQFDEARLEFNILTSLLFLRPELSNITLVGVNLALVRDNDGRISIIGIGKKEGETGSLDGLAEWISSQGELRLEKSNVSWKDEMSNGRKMRFSSVNLRLRNRLGRHLLNASVDLPENLGRSLKFYIDLNGNLLNFSDQEIEAYFYGEKLKFSEYLQTQSILGKSASVGETDFQLWVSWKKGALQSVEGEVDVDDVSLFAVNSSGESELKKENMLKDIKLKRVSGEFKWQRDKYGWQFDGNDVVLQNEKGSWLPSRVYIKVENNSKALPLIDAYASNLQLDDTAQIIKFFSVGGDEFKTFLSALHPRGLVHEASISWRGGDRPTYEAYAKLDRASTNSWRFIPATNDIYGQLWLEENRGQVVLDKARATLDFPSLFRWPIDINDISGQVDWTVASDSWSLMGRRLAAKNKDISATASFNFVKDNSHVSPFMSLVAQFKDGDGSQVAHYLPTGIMTNNAVEWLDTAIVGGHVVSGGTIMHGRLSDFPYDNLNGKFEVRFAVEDGRLNYAKGWPAISKIDADVQFVGRSMSINAKQGEIYSNKIMWAKVDLPNMSVMPMPLLVNGEVKGITQDKLKYLVQSPQLRESFGKHLEGMTASGESLLNLDLVLPVGNYKNTAVKGWVDLKNDSLAIPALGRVLSDVEGRLHFSQDGLSMDAVHADLFGQPTDLKISTETINKTNWIKVNAKGLFDAKQLARSYLPPITDLVDGKGNVAVLLNIPVGDHPGNKHNATLRVDGDFTGVGAKLPTPLKKTAEEKKSLYIDVDFQPDTDPILRATYGGVIDGVLVLNNKSNSGIKSGEIRINSGPSVLPRSKGLKIIGQFDRINLSDWSGLFTNRPSSIAEKAARPPRFIALEFTVENMEAYGQNLQNFRMVAKPEANAWHLEVNSNEVSGQITIPEDLMVNPVKANLDYVYLSEPTINGGDTNPRDIPSLDFQVKDLRYESRKFGSLKLETTRVANGVRIEQIVLMPRDTKIIASGSWYLNGEKHKSNIQSHIQSANVGNTMKELGYVGTIEGGEGDVDLQLEWPGALYDVDVNKVKGSMTMELKNGQLLEIDPGAGRLLGILSLQTLPRRLFLDFSDVFAKGFGFDQIKGKFNIENGNAYTQNLKLDGPAAKVEVKGRAGLAQKDYDQLVTVTPKVTDSLPVLGALTSTPQIGAVILFFQRIFKTGIEEATKIQYTITGHWDDPKITKLEPAVKKSPEQENRLKEESQFE